MRCLIFTLLTFIAFVAYGQQDQIPFIKYGVQEGLPEEYIMDMIVDDQGFIWCVTQLGVVRFDGYILRTITSKETNDGINLTIIPHELIKGQDGKIWMSGYFNSSIAAYDPQLNSFKSYTNATLDSSQNLFPMCWLLFEDSNRNIWFWNYSEELDSAKICRIDQTSKKTKCYSISIASKVNDILMNYHIAESPTDSTIWISEPNAKGLLRLNKTSDSFETILPLGAAIPGTSLNDSISDLTPVGKSKLLTLSSRYHVFLYDPVKRSVVDFFRYSKDRAGARSAFEDKKGMVWVTSGNSVSLYEPNTQQLEQFIVGEGQMKFTELSKKITSIVPQFQSESDIWFSVRMEGLNGFLRYHYADKKFFAYDSRFNFKGNQQVIGPAHAFMEDFSGIKWYGTRPNLYKEDQLRARMELFQRGTDSGNLLSDTVSALFEDSQQRLWVGTNNGLALYDDARNEF